jgi:hypothetical protein
MNNTCAADITLSKLYMQAKLAIRNALHSVWIISGDSSFVSSVRKHAESFLAIIYGADTSGKSCPDVRYR